MKPLFSTPAVTLAMLCIANAGASAQYVPNDPYYDTAGEDPVDECSEPAEEDPEPGCSAQFNLGADGINAAVAWEYTRGARSTRIAIIDSGVDYAHEDLAGQSALSAGELSAFIVGRGVPLATVDTDGDGFVVLADLLDAGVLAEFGEENAAEDVNANGRWDEQDLLALEGVRNGIDDDANGYADDILGYDFDDNDDEPADARDFGHGTGRAGIALAATDNGVGIAGVCPLCTLQSLRIGDTFIADPAKVARALIYAASSGAAAANLSLGVMGNSELLRLAAAYAESRGVVVVNASANEFSSHPNVAAVLDDVLSVGAVKSHGLNDEIWAEKYGFSNYGSHLDLVAPSGVYTTRHDSGLGSTRYGLESGTSSAAPHAAAAAALMAARADELNITPRPSAREIKQILRASADDINYTKWNTTAGWDQMTGWGLLDIGAAVTAVTRFGTGMPPVADITAPRPYAVFAKGEHVSVSLEIEAARADTYTWKLEVGAGVEPAAGDWETIFVSEPEEADEDAASFTVVWDTQSGPAIEVPMESDTNPVDDVYLATLRLTVTDEEGNSAVERQPVYVFEESDLLPGFPVQLASSVEGAPILVDTDGDGVDEIVLGDGGGFGHVINGEGDVLRRLKTDALSWPADLDFYEEYEDAPAPRSPLVGSLAAGDLNANGEMKIVGASLEGKIYVWDANDGNQEAFALETDAMPGPDENASRAEVFAAPTLADLDGDSKLEIIVVASDNKLYVWSADGSGFAGFPVLLAGGSGDPNRPAGIYSSPAVGDINGDGVPEIIVAGADVSDGHALVYAVNTSGEVLDGFPYGALGLDSGMIGAIPVIGSGHPSSPVLADFDGDGVLDILASAFSSLSVEAIGANGEPAALGAPQEPAFGFDHSPGIGANSNDTAFIWTNGSAALADLNNDGRPEVFGAAAGLGSLNNIERDGTFVDHVLGGWDAATGAMLPSWPRRIEDWQILHSPVVGDVDGDGAAEVVTGSGGNWLHAFRASGEEPAGWPKFVGGWMLGGPALGDLDGDGNIDVVAATRSGYVFAFKTPGAVDTIQWACHQHDIHHSGNLEASFENNDKPPTRDDEPLEATDQLGACSCRVHPAAPGSPAALLWLLAAAAYLAVIRRKARSTH